MLKQGSDNLEIINVLDSDFWMFVYNTRPDSENDFKYLHHLVAYH